MNPQEEEKVGRKPHFRVSSNCLLNVLNHCHDRELLVPHFSSVRSILKVENCMWNQYAYQTDMWSSWKDKNREGRI